MVSPTQRSRMEQEMIDSTNMHRTFAEKQVAQAKDFKTMTSVERSEMAMNAIRTQPGRPSRQQMILKLQREKGMTRAQAKEEIKRFDAYMVTQYLGQMENESLKESVSSAKVKPLTAAIFGGMGYRV